jgi:predicted oxidoreductase
LFTHAKDKIPYNPDQDIEGQVRDSIRQSLDPLKVDDIDSLLLHGPYDDDRDSIAAYKAFEAFVPDKVRKLGVSNMSLKQLQTLYNAVNVKPSFVQNRFIRDSSYDLGVRHFCEDHEITYQAFYMLTHNAELLEVAFYILILSLGDVQVLDGTTRGERMRADLETVNKTFEDGRLLKELKPLVSEFKKLLWQLAGSGEADVSVDG